MNDNIKRLARKIAVCLLGATMLFACAAFAACGAGGGSEGGSAAGAYYVSFYEDDGKTLIAEENVFAGDGISDWRLNEIQPKPAPEGYVFSGWGKVENVTEDIRLVASYEKAKFTLTFCEENGAVITTKTVDYKGGLTSAEIAEIVPAEKEGYTFKGWGEILNITADRTFTAQYKPFGYTVSFYYDDTLLGTVDVALGEDVTAAQLAEMEAEFDEEANGAYYLIGWDPASALTDVTEDKTVTALKGNLHKITFAAPAETEGGAATELAVFSVKEGEGVSAAQISAINVPAKIGYTFDGWGFTELTNVTESKTYTATYTVNKYSVKFYDYEGALVDTKQVTHGGGISAAELSAIVPESTKTGYDFIGWGYTEINNVMCDLNVIAQYKIKTYRVTFYRETGDTVVTTIEVAHGGSILASNLPAPNTKEGFTFAGWVDKATGNAVGLTNITTDLNLKESYTANGYAVQFKVNGTTVYTANASYNSTLTEEQINAATAAAKNVTDNNENSGYKFSSWPENIGSAQIKTNVTVEAILTKKTYTVTFNCGTTAVKTVEVLYEGKVSAADLTAATAAAVTEADNYKADTGKKFKCWNVADSSILSAAVTKNVTYTAQIVRFYTVTFEGATTGSVATALEVFSGEKVTSAQFETVKPEDKTGYDFDYWTKEGAKQETAEILAAIVTANVTYKPVYKTKQLTVTFYKSTADDAEVYSTMLVNYGGGITAEQMPGWTNVEGINFYYWANTREDLHTSDDPSNKVTSLTGITENVTLWAITDVKVYSVTFKGDGKSDYVVQVEHNKTVSADKLAEAKTALTKTGYDLDYFTTDGSTKIEDSTIRETAVTANVVYTAKYTKRHTLTFKNYDDSALGTKTVRNGEYLTASDYNELKALTVRTGYTFAGFVSGNVTLSDSTATTTAITSDMVFTATYAINQYKVTFKVLNKDGTELKSVEKSYDYNATLDSTALKEIGESAELAKGGYTFAKWMNGACYFDGTPVGSALLTEVTSVTVPANHDTVVYGTYTANAYSVKFKDANGNVVDGMTERVEYDSIVALATLKAKGNVAEVQKEGYSFDYWTHDGTKIENDLTFTFTTDLVLTPVYKINQYTVTFRDHLGQEFKDNTITRDYGTTITKEQLDEMGALVSREGYTFKGWTTSLGGTTCIDSLTVPANNTSLYPVYYVNVTFTVNGETVHTATVDIGGTIGEEQKTAATAAAKATAAATDYDFDGWESTISGTISTPTTIAANVTKLHTVTFKNVAEDNTESEIATYKVRNGEAFPAAVSALTPGTRANTDYRFIGWRTAVDTGDVYTDAAVLATVVNGNITYYAAFESKVQYSVYVYVEGYEYVTYGVGNDAFKAYFPYSTQDSTQENSYSDYDVAQLPVTHSYKNKTGEFYNLVSANTGNYVGYTTAEDGSYALKFKGFKGEAVDLSAFTSALPLQYVVSATNNLGNISENGMVTLYLDVNENELGFDLQDAFFAMFGEYNYPALGLTRDAKTGIVGFEYDLRTAVGITGCHRQAGIRLRDNAKDLYEDVVIKFSYTSTDYLYAFVNSGQRRDISSGIAAKSTNKAATGVDVWKTDVISLKSLPLDGVTDWYSINFTTNASAQSAPYQLIIESITYIEKGSRTYTPSKLLDITAPSYTSGSNNTHNVTTEKVALAKDGDTDVVRYTGNIKGGGANPVYGMLINIGSLDTSNYSSINVKFKASKNVNVYVNGYKSSLSYSDETLNLLDIGYNQGGLNLSSKFSGTLQYIWIGHTGGTTSASTLYNGAIQIDLYSIELVAKDYTITYNGAGSQSYAYGTKLTADELNKHVATASEGKTFVGWATTENATTALKGGEYIVTGAATLYPVFETAKYTVTFMNGDSTLKLSKVEHGSSPTAPTDPSKQGYKFVGWTRQGDTTGTVYTSADIATHQITAAVTYVAKYLQIVAAPTINGKTYTGALQTADVAESNYYEVTTNNGGTDVGEYDVVLTIKDQTTYTFDNGFTKTLKFNITKATATISGMPSSVAKTTCGVAPTISGVTSPAGTVTFVYATAADGTFAAETAIKAGTMYVKAYVAGTNNYNEAYSDAVSFTVEHKHEWVANDDNTQDIGKCACGNVNADMVYDKVVTGANDLLMEANATFTLSLEGIDYVSIKSFTYGEMKFVDEATDTMPTIPADAAWISGTHGVKEFTAVVTDSDGIDHTITVPVTFVTGVVTDWTTFLHTFQSHTGNNSGVFGEGTYYILGSDIEAGAFDSHTIGDTTYTRESGYNWHSDAATVVHGFAGVLDGRGHAVTDIVAGYGIFGVMKGATIKNIDFTVNGWTLHDTGVSLLGPIYNCTLDNVNVIFNQAFDTMSGHGVITGQQAVGNTFKNINVYAPGTDLDCLVMQGGTVDNNTFENITFYAKSYKRVANNVEASKIGNYGSTFVEVAALDLTSITVDETGEDVTVTKPSAFNDYAVNALRYNNVSLLTADGKLDASALLGAVKYTAGTYVAFMTLEKDGHVIRLPISVTFEGFDIEEIIVAETETSVAITLPSLFDDYSIDDIASAGGDSVKTNDNKIDVSALKNAVSTRGALTLTVKLSKAGSASLEVPVDVLFVTGVVTDWTTFLHTFQSHTGNNSGVFGEGTYYILGSDIEAGALGSHTIGDTTYTKAGPGSVSSADSAYGFGGTLDGRGHVIIGVEGTYGGLFGVMKGSTIKNIDFTISDWSSNYNQTSLLGPMANCTIENVNITFEQAFGSDKMSAHGVIVGQQAVGNTFKNINVYAPGSELTYLVGQGGTLVGNGNSYTGVNFYVKSYSYICNGAGTTTGVTAVTGINDFDVPSIFVGAQGEDVTVTKPSAFNDYAVNALRYNNVSLLTADGKLDASAFVTAVNGNYGAYTLFMILAKDGHEVRLPINVSLVTEVITTWEQLLYRVQYRNGVADKFGEGKYYVLGKDIVGGSTSGTITYGSNSWAGSSSQNANSGFAGTLDGLGHKVTGIEFSGTSIFGSLNGGTIKNITFEGIFGEGDYGLLGGYESIRNTTVENVTFKLNPEIKEDGSLPYTDFTNLEDWGLLARNQIYSCTFTNMIIHAEGFKFRNLTSKGYYGAMMNANSSDANHSTYTNCAVYAADYCYIAQTVSNNYSNDNYKFYSDVQEIELTGDTVSIALPTVMEKGKYYAFRVILNGKELTTTAKDGKTENIESTKYNAVDMANLSVEQIKEAIGDNYDKEYEIKFAYSPTGWNYGLTSIVLRVKFTQPA